MKFKYLLADYKRNITFVTYSKATMTLTTTLILRIVVGGLLGGLIGLEREYRAKEAGFRTHFLVALGSSLLTVISAYGFDTIMQAYPHFSFDPSRIAAQIVSGIGFIGAGLIIFQKNVVHGLTTAAGLWVVSAIGIACGVGHYDFAFAATILVLIALEAIVLVNHQFGMRAISVTLSSPDKAKITRVIEKIKADKVTITSYELDLKHSEAQKLYSAELELHVKHADYERQIMEFMGDIDGVIVEKYRS
jgi:putative Mg2+ transporter-C (MgtC) family protein